MALLTRRGLGCAGIAVGGSVFAGWAGGKPACGQEVGAPQVEMRHLSDIVVARPSSALPAVVFTTLDGARRTLADYAGKPVVLNFWATWCVPCVAELPELDRLAAQGGFTVLAVSADRGGASAVRPFAAAHHIEHATLLLDTGNEAVGALKVDGFPTTLLVGADGRLRATLEGPAAWGDMADGLRGLVK